MRLAKWDELRCVVANNEHTPSIVLSAFVRHLAWTVREAVAMNNRTADAALELLAQDDDIFVHIIARSHLEARQTQATQHLSTVAGG